TSSGTFFGISVTGAVALFFLIWFYGVKVSRDAFKLDDLTQELVEENRQLKIDKQELKSHGSQVSNPEELNHAIPFIFQVKGRGNKKIALITGRIEQVGEADVWVSSENTDMQMARYYDRSISGVIRYRGAKKDKAGNVIDDIIAKELKIVVDGKVPVAPTTVFVTDSGELAKPPNNVKKIFHVASVRGEAGIGYEPVKNIQFCVSEVLRVADSEECKASGIKSVLFPLLGAGTAKGNAEDIAQKLIPFALEYFETTKNSAIEYVYFLARTDFEYDVCYRVLQQLEQSGRLVAERGSN
ncbi:MAG TPA: macro domain-containing protein, partial [Ktedonobacteraceae bacterium]|nr:macro domain-containing protein [Ktedonobacteraceae bacterium]